MKQGFFKSLAKQIVLKGSVTFPGFGTFVSKHREAQINSISGLIYPPGYDFDFTKSASSDISDLEDLAADMNLDFARFIESVDSLIQEWNSKLAEKEIVEIKGLGRIYLDLENQLVFTQELSAEMRNPHNLPELVFKPIERNYIRASASVEKDFRKRTGLLNLAELRNWSNKSEIMPIVVAAASFLVILVVYLLMPKQPEFSGQSLAEKMKAERLNQKPSHHVSASLTKDSFIEIEPQLTESQLEAEIDEAVNKGSRSTESKVLEKKNRTVPADNQAIIITGAYRNIEGAKRKINQIVELGFNPYRDFKGDLNRVGVQFSYQSKADIRRMMDKVQQEVSERAWLLEE